MTDRDWSDTSTSQETQNTTGICQKLGERHKIDSPTEPPEGTNTADTLVSDF